MASCVAKGINTMQKMDMKEAKKMLGQGYAIMHIQWFSENSGYQILHKVDLEKKHPDCSHVLVSPNKHWTDANSVAALILTEEHDAD